MNSETRIEIAERMRGPFDVCRCLGHTYISGTLYGMQVCARNELALRDGMRRLADLIDPTCEVVGSVRHESIYDTTHYVMHKLSCGHWVRTEDTEPPFYCHVCGARVVSGDGK